jgi:cytochrome c peroxidase
VSRQWRDILFTSSFVPKRMVSIGVLAALFWGGAFITRAADKHASADFPPGLGLPQVTQPATGIPQLIALGKKLFSDTSLSADGKVACATCHQPARAFAEMTPTSKGTGGRMGTRNAPSLLNVVYQQTLFWEGRRPTLEEQVLDPLMNPVEHGLDSQEALLHRLRADPIYVAAFKSAFGMSSSPISTVQIAQALAAYLRTLISAVSSFDRYQFAGDAKALSESAQRGFQIFTGRAECAVCHRIEKDHALFTDHQFHSAGVGLDRIREHLPRWVKQAYESAPAALGQAILHEPELAELGRFLVTKDPRDIGKFKTPSLRNVALTAPYMHDGSIATLEDALDQELYYRSLSTGQPIILTPDEKAELLAFLKALTSQDLLAP